MQNTPITVIQRNNVAEPAPLAEYFERLQARYRGRAVHTPKEWPMNTSKGRAAYWRSQSRDRFLNSHTVTDLKHVLARAVARLETTPKGEFIDFNQLVYGQIQ